MDSDQAADPELASHYDDDSAEDTDTAYWRDPDANRGRVLKRRALSCYHSPLN
jgi:hypothetical protein